MAATKWRKILYEDQGVPDHYVDESFLDELKKNFVLTFVMFALAMMGKAFDVHIRTYQYWPVVKESGVVTQQLCSVCLFVLVFVCMDVKLLAAQTLVGVTTGLTLCAYSFNAWLTRGAGDQNSRSLTDDTKTALIFAGFSYSLSPVLVSLTETIATDTIYAMTTVMLLANLCFHDYGADAEMVSGVLSLNTGLFASVCLASRLHTALHSFATVTFAVQVFALWPALRRNLRQHLPSSHNVLTVVLGVTTVTALACMSVAAAVLFTIVFLFITFVCPAWLISIQPYKNNIYGPWDEAVIKE